MAKNSKRSGNNQEQVEPEVNPPNGQPQHPFKTGYEFEPTEVVTDRKLADQVDEMKVNYAQLAQLLGNIGETEPAALIRFRHNQLQLRNADTGKWQSIWLSGNSGEETIRIGPGEA